MSREENSTGSRGDGVEVMALEPDFELYVKEDEASRHHDELEDDSESDLGEKDHLSLLDPYYDLTTERLRVLFKVFDTDGIRTLINAFTMNELALGINYDNDAEFHALLQKIDSDHSRNITFEEFENAVTTIKLSDLFKESSSPPPMMSTPSPGAIPVSLLGVTDYSSLKCKTVFPIRDVKKFFYSERVKWSTVRWIHMQGVDEINIKRLAIKYRLHPLALEDALQSQVERPKFETYDNHSFLVLPLLPTKSRTKLRRYAKFYRKCIFDRISVRDHASALMDAFSSIGDEKKLSVEETLSHFPDIFLRPNQLSVYIMNATIISVEEIHPGMDVSSMRLVPSRGSHLWRDIQDRLKLSYSRLRQHQSGAFLVYTLVDVVTDTYQTIVNAYGAKLMLLSSLLLQPSPGTCFKIQDIHQLRNEVVALQRQIKPVNELTRRLITLEDFQRDGLQIYLRDISDHTEQILADCDVHLDTSSALINEFYARRSTKQDEVMEFFTRIATIFIPAQFLTGIYGMNFKHMPELEYEYAYLFWWIGTFVMILALYYYLRNYKQLL